MLFYVSNPPANLNPADARSPAPPGNSKAQCSMLEAQVRAPGLQIRPRSRLRIVAGSTRDLPCWEWSTQNMG
ncbi:hypothetical protein BKA67DRAFT_82827 [Truncatella angustata]|uniref:Uncharacterized protein n=1 Tax=Truncatella angustata TaxID=152316 RepID=A0A9P9A4N8_9PEZI|nr:uncharacterized protein BKA67DRAFT_82827 [Truncatella angustata]KAH6661353.1 hypothetical protein BKA67DRAFT_82827 [Truncatella angustata]